MRETLVEFYSEGSRVRGLWRTPEARVDAPYPALIQGPGWLGLKDANLYVRYHEAFTGAGFAVLVIDYRGFGDSEGDSGVILPDRQVEDLVNGVTYLTTRDDVDSSRIGVFGSGGTGGGNAVLLAAQDPRVRCAVVQVPVADGEDWLRGMRREDEWYAFLAKIDVDRVKRVVTGTGDPVHPREEITVSTPERRTTKVKADVDHRVPDSVSLRSAEAIMAYKPIDVVDRIAPRSLMIVAVEGDTVTPTDHSTALYQRARAPKRLVMQRNTTHYAAYDRYWETVTPMMVDWLSRGLVGGELVANPRRLDGIDVVEALSDAAEGES